VCIERLVNELPVSPARRAEALAAVTGVLEGGRAAMEHYGARDLAVDREGAGPVTEADRASNRAILDALEGDGPILSEESTRSAEVVGAARLWVVDPLDGTREFIDGIDEFSVMIGLAEEGRAVLGAVYRPGLDRLYVGVVGAGAWEIEGTGAAGSDLRSRALDARRDLEGPVRMVRSRSHPDERLRRLEAALADVDVVLSGSAGTKCSLVAADRADLYVHPVPYLKEWDTCAPEAVLRAAGGRVTDWAGGPLTYGKDDPRQPRGIFAATPAAYERAADAVARVVRETPKS